MTPPPDRGPPAPSQPIGRGVVLVTAAAALFVLSGYAVNVWIGRVLGPEAYGGFGAIIAVITILNVLQNAALPQAVARYVASQPALGAAVMWRALYLQLALSVGISVLLAAAADPLAWILGDPSLGMPLRLAAFILPPYGAFAIFQAYHNGRRHYTRQASAQAAYALAKATAVIAMAYPLHLAGAVLGYVAAAVVGCLGSFIRPHAGSSRQVDARGLIGLAATLSVYAVATVAQFSIDILFVKSLAPRDVDAGLYVAAQNIARIPYFLMTGLSVLILPAIAGSLRIGAVAATETGRQSLRLAMIVVVPPAVLLACTADGALGLVYGSPYTAGAPALTLLAAGMAAMAIVSVVAAALAGIGRARLPAVISVGGLGLAVLGNALLVPPFGPVGAAIATASSALITLIAMTTAFARGLPGVVPGRTLLRVVAASLVVGLGLAFLDLRGPTLVGGYAVAAAAGMLLLVAMREVGSVDLQRVRQALGWRRETAASRSPDR